MQNEKYIFLQGSLEKMEEFPFISRESSCTAAQYWKETS